MRFNFTGYSKLSRIKILLFRLRYKYSGITQSLDYFVDLGVNIVWINPIFKSPMDDLGFDVENYTEIDPIFGTMSDFEELISEMNRRGT